MNKPKLHKAAAIALIAAAFLAIYTVVVEATGFMPRCMFKWATGWDCPGCGSQRAFMALLHGDIVRACTYNLILPPAMVYLLLLGASSLSESRLAKRIYHCLTHPATLIGIAAIMVLWAVARNIFPMEQ